MKTLRDLKKFILIKCSEGNHAEIRSYVTENIDQLARDFHVSGDTIMAALEAVTDDRVLADRFVETILEAESAIRTSKKEQRSRSAQESAAVLASTINWIGERAFIDMPTLMASMLTRRDDVLIFMCDEFAVRISMAPLLDLSKIARARADLTGFVDAAGLHLRWKTGGLNLRSQKPSDADTIVLALPPRLAVAA